MEMLGEDPAVTGRAAIAKQGMREDSQITQALGGRVSSTEGTSADCFSPVLTSSHYHILHVDKGRGESHGLF